MGGDDVNAFLFVSFCVDEEVVGRNEMGDEGVERCFREGVFDGVAELLRQCAIVEGV